MFPVRFLVFCALFGFVLWPASAQTFKKTYRLYQSTADNEAALGALEKFRAHPKHGSVARSLIAKIKLRESLPLSALLDLNKELIQTEAQYRALSPKRVRRVVKRYKVDTLSIQNLREQTQRLAIVQVRLSGTFGALDSLEQGMAAPFPALRPNIDSTHMDIVQAHLDTRDYDLMTLIVKKHLAWIKPESYRRSRAMYDNLWSAFQDKYSLCEMGRYAKDHPSSFVGRDCWLKDVQQCFCQQDPKKLLEFHAKNPWTALEGTLFAKILDNPPPLESLSATQQQHLKDLKRRSALRDAMQRGNANRDTALVLREIGQYIQRYAPRFTAYKWLEDGLQFFLERKLYNSAIALLGNARPFFPDTLPQGCKTNFAFQVRVKPYIDGKLPILSRPPVQVSFHRLEGPNTDYGDESNPVLSYDGQTLYFAGAERPDNLAGQDIFTCQRLTDSTWTRPVLVTTLSGPGNQVPLSLTNDDQEMLLAMNGRLFLSRRTDRGWSAPERLAVGGIPLIGKGFLSGDGQTLVLEGSYETGGPLTAPDQDLFVSFKEQNGQWSRPMALGSDINTDGEEGVPFLSDDGRSLYYLSDGYPGLGRSDVFVSQRLGDKWTTWSRPQNLGKETNDTFSHMGFGHVREAGKLVFFAKSPGEGGKRDLWMGRY